LPESHTLNVKQYTALSELRISITQADTYLMIYDKSLRTDFTRLTRASLWYIDGDRKYYPVLYYWINVLFGNISELPVDIKTQLGNPTIADIALLFFTQTLELLKLKSKLVKDNNWQVVEPQFSTPNERVSLWESLLYYQQLHTGSRSGYLVKNFTSDEPPVNLLEYKQVASRIEHIRLSQHSIETLTLLGTVFTNLEDDHCQSLAIKLLQRVNKSIQEQSKTRNVSDLKLFSLKCNNSLLTIAQRASKKKDNSTVMEALTDVKSYQALMLLGQVIKSLEEPSSFVDARVKFLAAAEAEDVTEEEKLKAKQAAQDCRFLITEEKIEKARENKRQSKKQQPHLTRRSSAIELMSFKREENNQIYVTPPKVSGHTIDLNSPVSSSLIIPQSPMRDTFSPSANLDNLNPRQRILKENAALKKDYENMNNQLYN